MNHVENENTNSIFFYPVVEDEVVTVFMQLSNRVVAAVMQMINEPASEIRHRHSSSYYSLYFQSTLK